MIPLTTSIWPPSTLKACSLLFHYKKKLSKSASKNSFQDTSQFLDLPGTSSRNSFNTLRSTLYSSVMEHTTSKWRDLEWDFPSDLCWLIYLCVIMGKLGSGIAPLPSLLLSICVTITIPLLSLERSHILKLFFECVNVKHQSICFTYEVERNNSVAFLDV